MNALAFSGWAAFFAVFYLSHREVREARGGGAKTENRVAREPASDAGMALQFLALAIALFWQGPARPYMLVPSLIIMVASIGLVRAALQHLGRQWRVQAVVTDDHELVTTGPYSVIRHPIYLALLGMLVATVELRGHPLAGALALIIFLAGTEIRVRAEEKLLFKTFGEKFVVFLTVSRWAYLPGLR